ncbi:MAG: hypothetical protein K8I00_02545, partial [Candidatus Omnitrophica bacterium]|nr:hypothetical protein [Candidatus Omnitrophota bacterium]
KDSTRVLKDLSVTLQQSTQRFLKSYNQRLIEYSHTLNKAPLGLLKEARRRVTEHQQRLARVSVRTVDKEKVKLQHFAKIVEVYHPINTMKRGFSITRNGQGNVLRSIEDVREGEAIITQLVGGELGSRIQTIKRENTSDGE